MFKSLAILLAVALVATANQDYKSNRMKLLTQTVSARLHGEAIPSDQPQFKAVSRTKNLQASIPQGSQLQFQPQQSFQPQQQPQFVSQQFGTQMPMSQPQFSVPQQPQQFTPQFQAPATQQRAPSPIEQAQLQQQLQKQQQIQQQQQQINAQKAVQDQQVLQQQQQLIQQQQQQQHVSVAQPQQPIVPQQQPQQQFVVAPDASAISGAQAPISPLQQQQLMQQQQQQQMINSQQQSQIPQLQQQQAAQLQQQIQQQRVPQQPQQFVPQQPLAQQPQFVPQQPQQQFAPQQQQFQQQFQQPISSSGLAQTCSTAQPGDLVAHPSSPSSFIICYGFGEFTVMDCPEHLVFNAHTQRCDLTTDVPMGCASNPCTNNGRCTDLALGQFRCDCPIGFAGMQCERIDACSTNTCGGDGVCIALPAGSPVPNACMCNGGRSIGTSCATAEANPCIQPNSNLRLFSVNFNPSLFAHCEGARPNFMFCQAPLIFNAAKQSCDWPSRK